MTGKFETFEKLYKPIPLEDGSLSRDHDDYDITDADPHHVWTVLDCEGKLILAPGFHMVNYFARVLCEKPWAAGAKDYRFD